MTDHQQKRNTISLPHSVFSADWVRENEKLAARQMGVSLYQLMERAGEAAFLLCRKLYPDARRWLILCGHGNNGGDGYVIGRYARQYGIEVTLIGCGDIHTLPPEARQARDNWSNNYGSVLPENVLWPENCDLIIDGLLGTGIQAEPREPYASLIHRANQYSAPIVALDVPSGLNANTGAVGEAAIQASQTLTFVALKSGLLTGQARNVTGALYYDALGLSDWVREQKAPIQRLTVTDVKQWIKPRRPCSHKGDHGKLLVIGGEVGTGGAIRMAAEAALRTGSGLVRVLTRAEHIAPVLAARPELMVQELTEESLDASIAWADVIAIGPGLGTSEWAKAAIKQVSASEKIMLWDADALNLLAISPDKRQNRIITPHPGEAARLLQCNIQQIESDRLLSAQKLAERYGGVVVLKGAGTVIADENLHLAIADVGNAGMASGGMGDVLSGIIASLSGQGLSPFNAACAGCVIHGGAADIVAWRQGERGMIATDLLREIPKLVNP
ncbi:bifunctional ADP-dependent NAD(P)H-hydrate dehydratase/NAD(P)H-hydrate epimerase [Budviciaceae bacterium BWR-B9]|uniref:Bifunctional NAD(P)H-hydrate repair enzyme n=1 Tax=Limnobaculum allomyrinae TaxID=2791986 RepID=A0ABS1IRI4_9GAMM|nr:MULTISPECIES: bifunctional ADP-dependent NAD(P)H-hydrate dehydratase/NAD(P)H-hydrate epimerase [Limnobaculum]MBK5144177.1 bifunctional ADP-dependent NAD(P)H-hydrate dehydratase/NAD(P)H-hydrate epimerase [Limnobaculum allomyrinae]MBV7692079.1 bifunctional ADP-dependent NAD(P)H-hydrate dehydratase/NAD(P)H-hydrate epimerase [Limnobaculum sp. M2-1]